MSVVLERTPRHDNQANPAERALRTFEEQVKVMRLDFEKQTGAELLANSCLWPCLIRHAGWGDARFRVKTNGATPYQDACDSTYSSKLIPFGELVLFRIPLPHTRRTNQNRTKNRGDTGWDKGFWCARLDGDNAHIIVTENGEEIARTFRRLPLSQRVDVSLLKRGEGTVMGWTESGPTWSRANQGPGKSCDSRSELSRQRKQFGSYGCLNSSSDSTCEA